MRNVIGLNGSATGERRVVDSCVKAAQELLTRAESGEAIGVYVITREHDGTAVWFAGGEVGGFTMLGAMQTAQSDLMAVNRGEYEE